VVKIYKRKASLLIEVEGQIKNSKRSSRKTPLTIKKMRLSERLKFELKKCNNSLMR